MLAQRFVSMEECTGVAPYTAGLKKFDFDEVSEVPINNAVKEEVVYSVALAIHSQKDIVGQLVLGTINFCSDVVYFITSGFTKTQ